MNPLVLTCWIDEISNSKLFYFKSDTFIEIAVSQLWCFISDDITIFKFSLRSSKNQYFKQFKLFYFLCFIIDKLKVLLYYINIEKER